MTSAESLSQTCDVTQSREERRLDFVSVLDKNDG